MFALFVRLRKQSAQLIGSKCQICCLNYVKFNCVHLCYSNSCIADICIDSYPFRGCGNSRHATHCFEMNINVDFVQGWLAKCTLYTYGPIPSLNFRPQASLINYECLTFQCEGCHGLQKDIIQSRCSPE